MDHPPSDPQEPYRKRDIACSSWPVISCDIGAFGENRHENQSRGNPGQHLATVGRCQAPIAAVHG